MRRLERQMYRRGVHLKPYCIHPLTVAEGEKLRPVWDLKQGYHHISIFPEHAQYLGFSWSFQSRLRYFVFVVLPFGLADDCFFFTKVIRTFVKRWRILCHNCFAYIDDGISGHRSKPSLPVKPKDTICIIQVLFPTKRNVIGSPLSAASG